MGFKDAEWAYTVEGLDLAQKAVLAAVCIRTLDATHETFVSQETVAAMLSAAVKTVTRKLAELEALGVIARDKRHGPKGYRTTDLITVNTAYTAVGLVGGVPTRPTARRTESPVGPQDSQSCRSDPSYRTLSPDLQDSESSPTGLRVLAIKTQEKTHMNTQISPIPPTGDLNIESTDPFDDFWAAWPRKVAKPNARKAWAKAVKRSTPEIINAAAVAYRDNPHRPSTEFIPHPATWLNRDGWDDPLDGPRSNGRPTPTDRATAIARAGQQLIASRGGIAPVTTLRPKGLEG
ncbi:hypothetical protein [Microbacterium sp. Leaf179]|uniref:hypothetical protein n=1 Tax=Microbacterium sp. Leaf179 TaxID=1736288 RepID=UPI0006F78AE3|nr:hypothetical protein [Microbacterium sp. Leaf179]KQR85191.1 hypothetical protein ASF96_14745 [Microbacterium sp. Leaf179]